MNGEGWGSGRINLPRKRTIRQWRGEGRGACQHTHTKSMGVSLTECVTERRQKSNPAHPTERERERNNKQGAE